MADTNLLQEIQKVYYQLTNAGRKVADYVLQNKRQVPFMSITDLADECQVAEASVFRFCKATGSKGYQEFKMKLSLCIQESEAVISTQEENSDQRSVQYLADRMIETHMGALQETRQMLREESVERTVALMRQAERIHFFGIGDSLLTAREAANKFLRITGKVNCIEDTHMQAMAASMMSEKDLLIVISYSGATKDNIQVAATAKEAGANLVAITHFIKSPLTIYADEILLSGSQEAPQDGGSIGAKIGQLFMIDLLYQKYYAENQELSRRNKEKTSNAVLEKLF